jgi:hypothetical protein
MDDRIIALAQRYACELEFDHDTLESWECEDLTDEESAELFAWVRERIDAYRAGAAIDPDTAFEPSIDDLADWIGMDLGGAMERDRIARALIEEATR